MASPNISELATATIDARSKKLADNVTKNNVLWSKLNMKGNIRTFDGGLTILEELEYAENTNFGWYSGYDPLPIAAQDTFTSAQFTIKQCAVSVVISGLEKIQNSGRAQMFNLLEARIRNAEKSMTNQMASSAYADGTGSGGKSLTGLQAAVPVSPTTGTYGGIDRAAWPFWRSVLQAAGAQTATTIQAQMNALWLQLIRGKNRPDLIVFDNNLFGFYLASLQSQQRFTGTETGQLGFPSVKYMDADVVCDGGIGGFCPANSGWFLNTDYIFLRPFSGMNMKSLDTANHAVNQDAMSKFIAWAGNMTSNGPQFQGFFKGY